MNNENESASVPYKELYNKEISGENIKVKRRKIIEFLKLYFL